MTDLSLKAATPAPPATDAEPSLHRVMGPWLLLLFIVGDILGTGIYALTGQVAKMGMLSWPDTLEKFAAYIRTEGAAVGEDFRRLKLPVQD